MSRSRPIRTKDGVILRFRDGREAWIDRHKDGQKATAEQLELLATVDDVDLDDLLDEVLTQGNVVDRVNQALGLVPVIPDEVLVKRQRWRAQRQTQPMCRKCEKVGDSTKHHFVNKWILRELRHYQEKWANRSRNCIPLCIRCHRDLHQRDDADKSIVRLLTDAEKAFAQEAVSALLHERPAIFELQLFGDPGVYEARLIQDWSRGEFRVAEPVEALELEAA